MTWLVGSTAVDVAPNFVCLNSNVNIFDYMKYLDSFTTSIRSIFSSVLLGYSLYVRIPGQHFLGRHSPTFKNLKDRAETWS